MESSVDLTAKLLVKNIVSLWRVPPSLDQQKAIIR